MKVYISGPISGMPDLNLQAFADAAMRLSAAGHEPVNPHDIETGHPFPQWQDHMRADIKALMDCDAVAMLSGWLQSRGAFIEVTLAESLGMPCRPVDDWVEAVMEA